MGNNIFLFITTSYVIIELLHISTIAEHTMYSFACYASGFDRLSHMSRKALRYGPPTYFAAWAKAFGLSKLRLRHDSYFNYQIITQTIQ